MLEFDECNCCTRKVTTSGCLNCNLFKLKIGINQINEFIESHKLTLSNFIFYFNKDYYDIVQNVLNLNIIANNNIRIIPMLEPEQICMIIDKDKFDWGNIYLKNFDKEINNGR